MTRNIYLKLFQRRATTSLIKHLRGLVDHDLDHLPPNLADLCRLRVAIGLHLVLATLGEGEAEHTYHVAVRGLRVDVRLRTTVTLFFNALPIMVWDFP